EHVTVVIPSPVFSGIMLAAISRKASAPCHMAPGILESKAPDRHRRPPMRRLPTRRRFLATGMTATAFAGFDGIKRPYLSRAADRPPITHGLQSGDVSNDVGIVWARADRPARMLVEWSTTESFKRVQNAGFVDALPETDCTAKMLLENLPAGEQIFY